MKRNTETKRVPGRHVTLQACLVGDRILNGIMKAATAFKWVVDYSSLLQSDPPTSWRVDGLLRVSHRYLDLSLWYATSHPNVVLNPHQGKLQVGGKLPPWGNRLVALRAVPAAGK